MYGPNDKISGLGENGPKSPYFVNIFFFLGKTPQVGPLGKDLNL